MRRELIDAAEAPYSEWDRIASAYLYRRSDGAEFVPPPEERLTMNESIVQLQAMVQRLARFTAYMEARYGTGCGDQGHPVAVKAANKCVAGVRKALGYERREDDIDF